MTVDMQPVSGLLTQRLGNVRNGLTGQQMKLYVQIYIYIYIYIYSVTLN